MRPPFVLRLLTFDADVKLNGWKSLFDVLIIRSKLQNQDSCQE